MPTVDLLPYIKQAIEAVPEVRPYLRGRARWIAATRREVGEYKTQDAMFRQIWSNVLELYRGEIDTGEFIDAMASIVQEQLTKAFREALRDNDLDPNLVTQTGEGFADELETMILSEYDFVDGFASDILAGKEANSGFEQFRSRAEIWANRYNDAYNQANIIIADQYGNNLEWVFGDTEHCETCQNLNGIVAKASVWDELGVMPQQPPNDKLDCAGWRCQCQLVPTDKRQSPKAYDSILNIITAGSL